MLTTDGRLAEQYFLYAAAQIGLVPIENPSKAAGTIRKANEKEEGSKIDFIITIRREDHVFPVPLQLTLARRGEKLKIKKRMARSGKIALFWPGFQAFSEDLSGAELFNRLQAAAEGNLSALEWFDRQLGAVINEYTNHNRTKALIKRRLHEINNIILPGLPREIRKKISKRMKSRKGKPERLADVERILTHFGATA